MYCILVVYTLFRFYPTKHIKQQFNDNLLRICCTIRKILVILQRENRGKSTCEKKNIRKGKHHGTTEESTKGERTCPHPSA